MCSDEKGFMEFYVILHQILCKSFRMVIKSLVSSNDQAKNFIALCKNASKNT